MITDVNNWEKTQVCMCVVCKQWVCLRSLNKLVDNGTYKCVACQQKKMRLPFF